MSAVQEKQMKKVVEQSKGVDKMGVFEDKQTCADWFTKGLEPQQATREGMEAI